MAKSSGQQPKNRPSRFLLFVIALVVVLGGVAILVFPPSTSGKKPAVSGDSSPENSAPTEQQKPTAAKNDIGKKLDPRSDGWTSEVDAELAKKNLSKLLKLATANATVKATDLDKITPDFQCTALRPDNLVEVFSDASIRVLELSGENSEVVFKSAAGLATALSLFAEPLRGSDEVYTHAKIIRVTSEADSVTTTAIIESGGRQEKSSIGQNAHWICEWQRDGEELKLRSIRTDQYREVSATGKEGVWFADCTEAVLGKNASFDDQLVFGMNHWLERIERTNGLQVFARWGIAIGDVNGDGLDDLYICQPGGLPNRLLVQQADGTAIDQSAAAGVDWLDHTSSALLIDLDNDGAQDLVAATSGGVVVMKNDASGKFEWRATLPTPDTDVQSLTAADYDNDGDLDFYVCIDFANRAALRNEPPRAFVYYDANDGGANVLFRNDLVAKDKRWKFTDVTKDTGLDVNNRRHSLAASWEDYDNDGDQDLYVANDYGQNCLYRNDGGRFVDVAKGSGVVDYGSGMSVSWGDANRDGTMDLYVGNMFSSAGNRITRQSGFRSSDSAELRSVYGRFAKGNSLFSNQGSGKFKEVGADAGVEMGRWAWSSIFADLNNDGWQDLLVGNGYITTEDTGDL